MLRVLGVPDVLEGDALSWETQGYRKVKRLRR